MVDDTSLVLAVALFVLGIVLFVGALFFGGSSESEASAGEIADELTPVSGEPIYNSRDLTASQHFPSVQKLLHEIGAVGRLLSARGVVIRLSDGYEMKPRYVSQKTYEILSFCGIVPEVVGPWVNDVFRFDGGPTIADFISRLQSRLEAMQNHPTSRQRLPPRPPPPPVEKMRGEFRERVEKIRERWKALVDPTLGPPDSRAGGIRQRFEKDLKFLLSDRGIYDSVEARAKAKRLEHTLDDLESQRKTTVFKAIGLRAAVSSS